MITRIGPLDCGQAADLPADTPGKGQRGYGQRERRRQSPIKTRVKVPFRDSAATSAFTPCDIGLLDRFTSSI
jgi:hypothetical protein